MIEPTTTTDKASNTEATALLRPVRPMGGNAAVVREEKVMRLSVVSRHRGAWAFLDLPLPTALGERVLAA